MTPTPETPAECIAPPGNLCTDTGCWDVDRCIVKRAPETPAGGLTTAVSDALDPILASYVGPPIPHEAIAIVLDMAQAAVLPVVAAAVVQARAETLREVDAGEWFTEADVRAIGTRIEAVREGPRHCGCAWCCASIRPEYRGEAHQRTCHPLTATENGDDR